MGAESLRFEALLLGRGATYKLIAGRSHTADNRWVGLLTIRTGVFNPDEKRYSRTANVPLPYPTNDTRDLIQAALTGVQAIYLPGYRYQKAGVVLMHFVNPEHLQGDLFAPKPRSRSAELMTALDKINTTMGRGTVRPARVPASGSWAMKQQLKSPGYTCRWGELPSVR